MRKSAFIRLLATVLCAANFSFGASAFREELVNLSNEVLLHLGGREWYALGENIEHVLSENLHIREIQRLDEELLLLADKLLRHCLNQNVLSSQEIEEILESHDGILPEYKNQNISYFLNRELVLDSRMFCQYFSSKCSDFGIEHVIFDMANGNEGMHQVVIFKSSYDDKLYVAALEKFLPGGGESNLRYVLLSEYIAKNNIITNETEIILTAPNTYMMNFQMLGNQCTIENMERGFNTLISKSKETHRQECFFERVDGSPTPHFGSSSIFSLFADILFGRLSSEHS